MMECKPLEQWSDDEIREALRTHNVLSCIPPITPQTRPFLEKKLADWFNVTSTSENYTSVESRTTSSAKHNESPITPGTSSEPVEGYYGVAGPASTSTNGVSQLSPYYTSKTEALKAIKCIPGARFKRFESREGAEAFSLHQLQTESLEQSDSPFGDLPSTGSDSSEKPNTFPSLKTPDLNKFRMMIEKGEVDSFLDCVNANPRYLISSGDAPPLLKVSVEYNALHCAVKSRQLEICQHVLAIVQSDEFWMLVYTDDTEHVRLLRKDHLLDLYLNRQDKGCRETPLHFACKLGYEEIVSFLVTFPMTSTTIRNKYGKTPAEVVCDNVKTAIPGLKEKIKESLREPKIYYVPVFRTEDNSTPPSLGMPCTIEQLDELEAQTDESGLSLVSNGLAGPMSPRDAKKLYCEWKTPTDTNERKQVAKVKRSDSERGLERIGRQLAHKAEVGWEEYWEFLGCSCDLSKPEGQQQLEEFLQLKASEHSQSNHKEVQTNASQNDSVLLSESPLHDWQSASNKSVPLDTSDLSRQLFTDDDIEGYVEEAGVMEVIQETQDEVDGLTELLSKKLSVATISETVQNSDATASNDDNGQHFILGSAPTKLDHDVLLAFCDVHPDPSLYPCISKWLGLVRSFSEKEQKSWKQRIHRPIVDPTPSPLPVSPLVFSSPSTSMNNYSYGNSSPLILSGTSLNHSVHDTRSVNTTPTHQASVQRRYWQRQSTTPRGRHTPVGIRVRSTNTTPRRMRMTPTSLTSYGRLSFTPKI